MTQLPDEIRLYFFKAIKGDIILDDFEKRIYNDNGIEAILGPDDYLDLISINYKSNGAKYELYNLLIKHIDLGEYETYKLLELLEETKKKNEKLPYYLMNFYDLYCRGYGFLQGLGIGYGLSIEEPIINDENAHLWSESMRKKQDDLLASFSPGLEIEIQRIENWLRSEKIALTGEQDELGHYGWIDNRSEYEKQSVS